MKKRIGNDFTVSWSITRIGQPESFEPDMPIKVLILNASYSWVKIEPTFHIISNAISFTVPADKQQPGRYRIMLQYQKRDTPQKRTYTVDVCNAFELVSDSCNDDITDGDVSLNSDVKIYQDGKDGLNAYQLAVLLGGFDGTAEEYVSSIRQPSLDAAAEAVTATQDLRILERSVTTQEDLREKEEARRKAAESARSTAEGGRVSAETLRVSSEQKRIESDELCTISEDTRNENERNRNISETNRADSEILRAESETIRVKQESLRAESETGRANAETLRTSSEQNRTESETLRVSAEKKRGTDFISFLDTSAGQVKTEVDKVAPVITSCAKATEDANVATGNATTQADYAKEQGDYAKEQATGIDEKIAGKADITEGYINENQVNPLTGTATSMRANSVARSGCNLYNWKKGVTYVVAFIPQEQNAGKQKILDFTSYSDLSNRFYGGLDVRYKKDKYAIGFYAPNYFARDTPTFFYSALYPVLNKINLIVCCIYNNSVKLSLNGSAFEEATFTADAYPEHHEYGASPVGIDVIDPEESKTFAKICSFKEFNYVVSEDEKDGMWNFGSPDKFMTPESLKSETPDLPLIGTFDDFSLRTNATINVTQEEGSIAVVEFLRENPAQWLNVFSRRKLKNVGCKYRVRLVIDTDTPINIAMYAHMAGNDYSLVENMKNGINGNVGNDLVLEYDILVLVPSAHLGYFEKISGGTLVGAVIKIKEISIVQQLSCTGEYLASGFRKNKLIDTSGLKRDISITTGKINLNYGELYPEIIYKSVNPSSVAQFIGQRWFNITSKSWYIASGTSALADWVTLSGIKALAYRVTADENNIVSSIEALYGVEPVAMRLNEHVYIVEELPAGYPVGYSFDGVEWIELTEEEETVI